MKKETEIQIGPGRGIPIAELVCIIGVTIFLGGLGHAQTYTWIGSPGSDSWNDSANWNPSGIPNAAGESAVLNSGPVRLNPGVTIDSLVVGTGVDLTVASFRALVFSGAASDPLTNSGTITMEPVSDLRFSGNIANIGTISLSGSGVGVADIDLAGDAILSGGGTITMSNGRFKKSGTVGAADVTLTVADQTIEGSGFLGENSVTNIIVQAGNVVDANEAGEELFVDIASTGSFTNRGTLQASQGGILNLTGSLFDNAGGLIQALDGSTVELGQLGVLVATIRGGTLSSSGSGSMQNSGGTTSTRLRLEDVTIQNQFIKGPNSETTLIGTITNEGTIVLNSGATEGTGARLRVEGNATLTGGGAISFSGFARMDRTVMNEIDQLTIDDQTLEGSVKFGSGLNVVFSPNSTVNANIPGQTMTIETSPTTPTIANGTITVSPESTLEVSSGGAGGTLSNGGFIRLNSGPLAEAVGALRVTGNTTLNGGGTISMEGPNTRIEGNGSTPVLENQTIQGSGTIAPTFTPTYGIGSVLHANRSGETLSVQFPNTRPPVSAGDFIVNSGSTLSFNPTPGAVSPPQITHSGSLVVNGAVSAPGTTFRYTAGSQISGFGNLSAAGLSFNGGRLAPGASPGILTLTMETAMDVVELGAEAVLALEIGGTSAGTEHDVLNVQGGLTLGGKLEVSLLGFQPDPADVFTVITQSEGFGALTGTFDGIADGDTVLTEDGGGTFVVNYQTAAVTLSGFALTPFGEWKQANLGGNAFDPVIGDPSGDPNRNGIQNLLEFALALDPDLYEPAKLPQIGTVTIGDTIFPVISFRRLTGDSHGLVYSVWESTDLENWAQLDLATFTVATVDNGDGSETVTVRGSTPSSGVGARARNLMQVRVAFQDLSEG